MSSEDIEMVRNIERQFTDLLKGKSNKEVFDLKKHNLKTILQKVTVKLTGMKSFLLKADTVFYTLNDRNAKRLLNLLNQQQVQNKEILETSDGKTLLKIKMLDKISIERITEPPSGHRFESGGYFPYYNNTTLCLDRFGIHTHFDKNNYQDNCLVIAFRHGGMLEQKLDKLKSMIQSSHIPKCKLNEISQKLNIKIILHHREGNRSRPVTYGTGDEVHNIGLLESHYFINEPVGTTTFAMKNYQDIKDKNNWHRIVSKDGQRKNRTVSSYLIIEAMLDNKEHCLELIPHEDASQTHYDYKKAEIKSLDYDLETNTKTVEYEEKEMDPYYKIYFDFEADSSTDNESHIPYLCCSHTEDEKTGYFTGAECGLNLLKSLYKYKQKKIILIAHNAGYDFTFIAKHLTRINHYIPKGGFMACTAMFGNIEIKIKCSYKLISHKLAKFKEIFKLSDDYKKEIMPYGLYTQDNIKKVWVPITECKRYLSNNDYKQMKQNIKDWGLDDADGDFNIMTYSLKYCETDCLVLKQGYETFRGWIQKDCGLDIDNLVSSASLAHKYMVKEGVYDGVLAISGTPREFIQRCVVGGRCMMANNEKQHIKRTKIDDFDACGLYSSSMIRIPGLLKGAPKVLQHHQLNKVFLDQQDGYFVQCKIKKMRWRRFPLASRKNDKGIRMFTNDMIGHIIYIDKFGLEDLMEYQDVEVDIIRGYYFDEGRNDKIREVIKFLFDKRVEFKKVGNPIQEIYKLIMNSAYGKSLLAPIEHDIVVKTQAEFEQFVLRKYDFITQIDQVGDKYFFKLKKTINDHFNSVHVGCEILSMSKRIMNEVMTLAEDNQLDIYYQDTDSMHMKKNDVPILAKLFKDKYDRELIGNGLGQFHSDFDLVVNGVKATDVYSKELICLGKKCYIDRLVGIIDDKEVKGYHTRMKGIPEDSIEHRCETIECNKMQLYKGLYKGETHKFDLTCGGKKTKMKKNSNITVSTLQKFERRISFKDGDLDIETDSDSEE